MLVDVTAVLRSLIAERLPGALVRIGPSSRTGTGEEVWLYLYQVSESTSTKREQWTEERDAAGRVVRRTAGEPCLDLRYQVTAWADEPEQELALLDGVLAVACTSSPIPRELLPEALATSQIPVTVVVAPPSGLASTCLELMVTAPFPVEASGSVAEPPTALALGTGTRDGRRPGRRTAALISEGGR